jgi:hypothetical protein
MALDDTLVVAVNSVLEEDRPKSQEIADEANKSTSFFRILTQTLCKSCCQVGPTPADRRTRSNLQEVSRGTHRHRQQHHHSPWWTLASSIPEELLRHCEIADGHFVDRSVALDET